MDTHQLEERPVLYRLLHRQECETIGGLGQGHYLLSQDKLTCTGAGTTHREVHIVHLLRTRGGLSHCLGRTNWLSRVSACTGMQNISMHGGREGRGVKGGEGRDHNNPMKSPSGPIMDSWPFWYLAKSSTHP